MDLRWRDVVFLCYIAPRSLAVVCGSDFKNFFFSEEVGVSGQPLSFPVFVFPVGRVVGVCSGKEVKRVYASGVVAGMANNLPLRNRPVFNYPCKPVSLCCLPLEAKTPVSLAAE